MYIIRLNKDKVYTTTLARNVINYIYDNTDKTIVVISSNWRLTTNLVNKIADIIRNEALLSITSFSSSRMRLDNGNRILSANGSNREFGMGYNIDFLIVNHIEDLNAQVMYSIDSYILPIMKARQNSKSIITY